MLSLRITVTILAVSHAFHTTPAGPRRAVARQAVAEAAGVVGVGGFLAWAFQGVGPSDEAAASIAANPPQEIQELNGLLFGDVPKVALYCGAKIRPESYAPLARRVADEVGGGVLVLQSPFNVYAFKPATVEKVLSVYPSITCVAGHSIGGLWAAEFCRDLKKWPANGLSFFFMGVHGSMLDFSQFKALPFSRVGWSVATEDVTMQRCVDDDECDTSSSEAIADAYIERTRDQFPSSAKLYRIDGGNHEQYGYYGSPSYDKGLAYKDLVAKISAEEQCALVAAALADTARGGS